MRVGSPSFRTLDAGECEELLTRHHHGRLAFAFHERVDVEPMHYVWHDRWIYGRTSFGTKLRALARNRLVAFEIDEVDATFSWRSVVVKGTLSFLVPAADGMERDEWELALNLLRRIVPEALSSHDPTPNRTVVFRIRADVVSGRAASTG